MLTTVESRKIKKRPQVAIVSSALPRKCGIATFSADVSRGIGHLLGREATSFIAVNDNETYEYPSKVIFQIEQDRLEDYQAAAAAINESAVDVVSLQHEYGLYGGEEGSHIVEFLSRLNKPVVTTLHTILEKPTPDQYKSLVEVIAFSKAVIVMNRLAIDILTDVYDVPEGKIHLIPHGVTDMFYIDPLFYQNQLELQDRFVMLTFGFISRNKGIEVVLEALPAIVEEHPEVLYIVLGITHPVVKKHDGEEYRDSLEAMVTELGLDQNVRFVNEFVDDATMNLYLGAADLVILPYHSETQITSGVLSQAIGKGKAVIATPYLHARDALSDGKGRLVNFKDPAGMTDAIRELIQNPDERLALAGQAFIAGQQAGWEKVTRQYVSLLEDVVEKSIAGRIKQGRVFTLPDINMDHLKNLTDDAGMVQHTLYGIHDFAHYYSSDDAGRAMVAFTQYFNLFQDASALQLVDKYMAFVIHARRNDGWFYNYMNYQKEFPHQEISQDTFGRCLWGLGAATRVVQNRSPGFLARTIVEESIPMVDQLTYTRAQAYAANGIAAYLILHDDYEPARKGLKLLCDSLLERYRQNADGTWNWFEDFLTYDNARLAQALLLGYQHLGDPAYLQAGLQALDFLIGVQYQDGCFDLIGNDTWYAKGGEKALYCQQPVDAGALTETCILAMTLTGNEMYLDMAYAAFQWYLGRNRQGVSLYNPLTGACADGLGPEGPSSNQGAESTLSFVIALVSLYRWELVGRFQSAGRMSVTGKVADPGKEDK
ncbi:MAG: glycosyltransferase [Bacillota bacterium]|nr:glycosyltransferase [Bacillota bacterium]